MVLYPYRKSDQFERYIGQFMRVFSGFQVRDGVARGGETLTKKVPVVYGNMSRIVASILTKRDHFTNTSLPFMAANLVGIEIDLNNRKSPHHQDTVSKYSIGSSNAVERLIGPAFILNMDLSIYASSSTELFGLLEQILLVFNPRVAIQVDTDADNSDYITEISLSTIQPEMQYPLSTNKETVMLTLGFTVPVRLRYPHDPNAAIIQQITLNLKEESSGVTINTETIPE